MNALVPQNFGPLSTRFAGREIENDLGAGVSGGYSHIGYKGKVWSIRHKGNEQVLMREDGDGPRGSIEVVILKASQAISKVWYEKGFEEGTKAKPDCFSANGVTPDPTSVKKQASVCASCPRNAFGSAIKQDGTAGKGKACSDSKRLAVVPLQDINNEMLGGPMLLRVPAASLNDVATYGDGVKKMGYPYYAVGTRIAFDPQDAYPKFVLSPMRPLTDAEADMVLAHRTDPRVDRILAEDLYEAAAPAEEPKPAGMAFEQPAQAVTPAVTPAPAPAAPAPAPAKPATARRTAKPPAAAPAAPAPAGGFGAAAPAAEQAPAGPAPAASAPAAAPAASAGGFGMAAPATAPGSPGPATAGEKSFDDALDAEMAELMGGADA